MKALIASCLLISTMGLSACTWHRTDTGMVAGAAVGGLAGSALTGGSPAGTIIGAVGGGFAGRELAR